MVGGSPMCEITSCSCKGILLVLTLLVLISGSGLVCRSTTHSAVSLQMDNRAQCSVQTPVHWHFVDVAEHLSGVLGHASFVLH